ncbi:MAG: PTS sugar transporter subunit IIA [Rhodothermales bacterium]
MSTTRVLDLHDLLTPDTVEVGLPGESKEEVIDHLINLLAGHRAIRDLDDLRDAILERERIMSTGVGKGLALPHAKTSAVRESIAAFAVTKNPIDFGSIDNAPVRLIFLLVGTEAAKSEHIKILSRVSRLMNRDQFRNRLLQAPDKFKILSIFEEGEADLLEG